jgi:hypothetical protein
MRSHSGGELAQARIRQIGGRPILVEGWVHAGGRLATRCRRRGRRRLPEGSLKLRAIWPPEPSARHLEHLHLYD